MTYTAPTKMLSRPTSLVGILLAALSPLVGILYFGWDWRSTLIFYWLFNVTVGVAVILGIILTRTTTSLIDMIGIARLRQSVVGFMGHAGTPEQAKKAAMMKAFVVLFFFLHYGLFTLVHGIFVFAITAQDSTVSGLAAMVSSQPPDFAEIVLLWFLVSVIQIVAMLRDEKLRLTIKGAYTRIATLHFSIILGLFLIVLLDWPAVAAVLLVGISLIHDLVQYGLASKAVKSKEFSTTTHANG